MLHSMTLIKEITVARMWISFIESAYNFAVYLKKQPTLIPFEIVSLLPLLVIWSLESTSYNQRQ